MWTMQLAILLIMGCLVQPGVSWCRARGSNHVPAPIALPAGGCPDPFVGFNNTNLIGGTEQAGIATLRNCQTSCLLSATCRALSFQDETSTCVFYTLEQQGQAITEQGWIHQQKTQCSSRAGAAVTLLTCTSGAFVRDGTLQPGMKSIVSCENMCAITSTCHAIDFNFDTRSCFFHRMATSCGELEPHPSGVHCKRVACDVNPAPNTAPAGFTLESIGFHILGGTQVPGTHTTLECLTTCTNDATCLAVDYNKGTGTCRQHTTVTACGNLRVKNEDTSFRKSGTVCP